MMTTAELPDGSLPALASGWAVERAVIPVDGIHLTAERVVPANAEGVVLLAGAGGCIRETRRQGLVARQLEASGLATLVIHLLTRTEAEKDELTGYWSFDLELLNHRLIQVTRWVRQQPSTQRLGIGYLGTGTGAAAALVAAAELGGVVQAVVARGGRPDFAGDALPRVTAPTLFIVGERDTGVLNLNRHAYERLGGRKQLAVIPGAGHLFEEAGALEQVATLATDWFRTHLKPPVTGA